MNFFLSLIPKKMKWTFGRKSIWLETRWEIEATTIRPWLMEQTRKSLIEEGKCWRSKKLGIVYSEKWTEIDRLRNFHDGKDRLLDSIHDRLFTPSVSSPSWQQKPIAYSLHSAQKEGLLFHTHGNPIKWSKRYPLFRPFLVAHKKLFCRDYGSCVRMGVRQTPEAVKKWTHMINSKKKRKWGQPPFSGVIKGFPRLRTQIGWIRQFFPYAKIKQGMNMRVVAHICWYT